MIDLLKKIISPYFWLISYLFSAFQGDKEECCGGENPCTAGADSVSRIQLLETELAEALEENNINKHQLQRWVYGTTAASLPATRLLVDRKTLLV